MRSGDYRRMQFDLASVLLALGGIGVVCGFAVLAGAVSARVFFDATSGDEN